MIVVAFDTETTGLVDNHTIKLDKQPEIIELYACAFDDHNGKVLRDLDLLLKPSRPIADDITAITGITNAMVADQPPFKHYSYDLMLFLEDGNSITGHNLSYDMEMVELEMERLKCDAKVKWPPGICTVEQTVHLLGIRLSLSALHDYLFGEKFTGAHRAKQDVKAQMRCYMELKKRGEL